MVVGQARVVVVEEKWSCLGNILNVKPPGFADRLDV